MLESRKYGGYISHKNFIQSKRKNTLSIKAFEVIVKQITYKQKKNLDS